MNNALYNIKQSSFLTRYFEEAFKNNSVEQLSLLLDEDIEVIRLLHSIMVLQTIKPDNITISYIHKLYLSGFNFQEIGELKNITKMGVRHHLHTNLSKEEFNELKFRNKENRKSLKNNILRYEITSHINDENYNIVRQDLGYSESYFKVFLSRINK